jgi:nitrite reductase/ring-hydroxylating ferredoxin subunit
MNILQQVARRLERLEALDKVAKPLAGAVDRAVRPRVVRNLLSGTDLGHPLPPMLTDLPIGAWVMSAPLDAAGGPAAEGARRPAGNCRRGGRRADRGCRAERPVRYRGPETRVGLVHAAVNTTALSLYLASAAAGARGRRRGGKALGLAGLGVLPGGGYLGGHLCFVLGVDVNRTAWEQRPSQWTPVLADTELADGELCRADAGGVPVLLYRTDRTVYAPASTCTHMGGPLQEDTISDGCVTCPWPGTFRFADGSLVRSHARALLPDAHPERAHRGPRLHISVADLSHRRGSSQKTPFCAPRTDPTEEAVPLQNGGYLRGVAMAFGRSRCLRMGAPGRCVSRTTARCR